MTNPYESAFGEDTPHKKQEGEEQPSVPPGDLFADLPEGPLREPLDEILDICAAFKEKATSFVQLLSATRAVDYKVSAVARQKWLQYLVQVEDPQAKEDLAAERKLYELLQRKFRDVIVPMKDLAQLHLDALKRYHNDIDEHYYSVEKTALEVKRDLERAKAEILLQRKILFDAQEALQLLSEALEATEIRMDKYVNAGGKNNISGSELALLRQERRQLTEGQEHRFNYGFFALNLLDKLSLQLSILPKETSSQYLDKLSLALEAREES